MIDNISEAIIHSFIRGDEGAVVALVRICRNAVVEMTSECLLSVFTDGTIDSQSEREVEAATYESLRIIVDEFLMFAASVKDRDDYSEYFTNFVKGIAHRCATERLIAAIKQKHSWAIRKLREIVLNQAKRLKENIDGDAEDLAHDAITRKILPKFATFNPMKGSGTWYYNFRRWIWTIVKNLYIDDYKKKIKKISPPPTPPIVSDDLQERLELLESALKLAKEKRQGLIDEYDKSVEEMSLKLRDLAYAWKEIILSTGEYGLYIQEIAASLDISPQAVYNLRKRLMDKTPHIQQLLEQISDRTDQIERVEELL